MTNTDKPQPNNEKLQKLKRAFADGILDGLNVLDFEDLTSGLSFPDQDRNEAYDHGVNVGQAISFLSTHIRN